MMKKKVEREKEKRAAESETAESSQRASTVFSSEELPTSKWHKRKLFGVGKRIIAPEQALELIKLSAHTPPVSSLLCSLPVVRLAHNPKFELRRIPPVLASPLTEKAEERKGIAKKTKTILLFPVFALRKKRLLQRQMFWHHENLLAFLTSARDLM
jgi:hypothetical protein